MIKQFSMRTRIKNPTHKLGGINIWCFFLEQPTQPLKQIQIRLGSKNSPIGTFKIVFENTYLKNVSFEFSHQKWQVFVTFRFLFKNLHQVQLKKIASL